MKTLKKHFNKNGLEYSLVKRTDKIALFRLGDKIDPDGYEVSRIYIMPSHKAFGVMFEESQRISSDSEFIKDGSGSFRKLEDALRHYDKMNRKFLRQEYVELLSSLDDEVIPECQPVEDNVL